jgi:transcription elongation factor Elf1
MQKTEKTQRTELYQDRNTLAFLSKFLSGEITELEPVFDPKVGYHYPIVATVVGDAKTAEAFLNKLYEAGILERKLYDKVIYCPKCNSANISIRYSCPYCKSYDVQRSALIEHVKCGYMDVEKNFRKENILICPKCHDELKRLDVDHRKAGIWCTCKECGKSFDIPVAVNFCRDCRVTFTFEEARIENVYSYTLGEEAKEEVALGWVMIAPIKDFLVENDFEVESPAFVKGKSGATHTFDIAAYTASKKQDLMVIDVSTSAEAVVSEQPVIALFAKIFDVSPERAYLIAIPRLSENGRKMAELYNIKVIEAKNQKEAIKALVAALPKK